MRSYIKVENDVIVDVKFKTFGCGAAIATSSKATEMVMDALGGLPEVKIHCSVLAEEALHEAIKNYKERQAAGEISGSAPSEEEPTRFV